jgi:hypothetical protein
MRNQFAKEILERTPKSTHLFVSKCVDLSLLVNDILKRKGITKQELAKNLDKSPSEITKWLSGEHNLTLKSLCMLEAELDEEIISIPKVEESVKQHFSSPVQPISKLLLTNTVHFSKGVSCPSGESSLASCAS